MLRRGAVCRLIYYKSVIITIYENKKGAKRLGSQARPKATTTRSRITYEAPTRKQHSYLYGQCFIASGIGVRVLFPMMVFRLGKFGGFFVGVFECGVLFGDVCV